MSSSKNYNSIVFLTTLSVYLGLVLVGGASPILAQAALTQKIEIQNEAEIKDDLDKKPDEDLFALPIANLVSQLNEFSKQGLFTWNAKNQFEIESLGICESDNSPSLMGSGTINHKVDDALEKSAVEIARHLFNKISSLNLGDIHSHTADFTFVIDNNSFVLTTKVDVNYHSNNKKDIHPFINSLSEYLKEILFSKEPATTKIIAENTQVTSENNQVFIITNLPRAALDEILADKDAN